MRGRFADIAATASGYVIGSIPVGVVIGRAIRGMDVREHGSGSMGTTNVLRLVGPTAAVATFALDVGKGSAAVLVAKRLGADRGGQAAAGLAAVVGHSWPALARFRGGKGVATAFGAIIFVSSDATVFAVAGGLSALALTRIMSVGSLSAAASAILGAGIEEARSGERAPLAFAATAATLIALRHSANIRRLLRGEEPRVSLRRKTAS